MATEEGQGVEKGGEDVWCNAVKRFPDGVRDGVRHWGRGGRALSQGGGDLIRGEGGAVCKGAEDRGEGLWRLRRKEVVE